MIAQVIGAKPDKFHHVIGDAHIYLNHVDMIKTQLERSSFDPPTIVLNSEIKDIDKFKVDDVQLLNYNCHAGFRAKVAV
jgi:thymidylate synthase